jgi:hypothetical protein
VIPTLRNGVSREREKKMLTTPPPLQAEIAMSERTQQKKALNSVWLVLQGPFFIAIGIVFLVLNLSSPYKEMTGYVQNWYDQMNAEGQYAASYLQISTASNDLFIFDKNALHPGQLFKNERVDVYYSYPLPYRIVALQLYDSSGHPTTKFTTTDYTASQHASPLNNPSLDIGGILILLGTLWISVVVFVLVKTRLQLKRALIN